MRLGTRWQQHRPGVDFVGVTRDEGGGGVKHINARKHLYVDPAAAQQLFRRILKRRSDLKAPTRLPQESSFIVIVCKISPITPSTYLQMPVNLRGFCHYVVVKWNIGSKYLAGVRRGALRLRRRSPPPMDLPPQSLFILPQGTWTLMDSDKRIKPRSDTIFITCMATRRGGGGGGGASLERTR